MFMLVCVPVLSADMQIELVRQYHQQPTEGSSWTCILLHATLQQKSKYDKMFIVWCYKGTSWDINHDDEMDSNHLYFNHQLFPRLSLCDPADRQTTDKQRQQTKTSLLQVIW